MDKANIIISIIIVLCIAAAVAAYGITNSDNPIFSDLSSMPGSGNNGDGTGNNTTHINNKSTATTSGSSGGDNSGSGGSSDGGYGTSDSGSSTYDNGGSSYDNGGSSSDNGGSSSSTELSYSTAQSIANGAVAEPGCYAGGGYYSNGYWFFTIYDEDGNAVDTISVNDATGATGRG